MRASHHIVVPLVLLTACSGPSVVDDTPRLREAERERAEQARQRERCFERHEDGECDRLADAEHARVAQDPGARARACEAQEHGCLLGGFFSCGHLAERCALAPDEVAARTEKLLREGCQQRRRDSCKRLQMAYSSGLLAGLRSPEKSAWLDERLCAVDEYFPCRDALRRRAAAGELDALTALARDYGCPKKRELNCDLAAVEQIISVFGNESTPTDRAAYLHALALLERACAADVVGACARLHKQLADGPWDHRDPARLQAFEEARCQAGQADLCLVVGQRLAASARPGDAERAVAALLVGCPDNRCLVTHAAELGRRERKLAARPLYERACLAGADEACGAWGDSHPDVPRAEARRVEALLEERAAASVKGKLQAGHYYSSALLDRQAIAQFEAACDGGERSACLHFALLLLAGGAKGPRERNARAVEILTSACEKDDGEACYALARAYASGKRVKADRKEAVRLTERACSLKYVLACPDPGNGTRTASDVVARFGREMKEALGGPAKAVGGILMSPFCILGARSPFCPLSW